MPVSGIWRFSVPVSGERRVKLPVSGVGGDAGAGKIDIFIRDAGNIDIFIRDAGILRHIRYRNFMHT